MALRGYQVHGTDISPAAVERAQREAARLGATLTTAVADLRALDAVPGTYAVVLSCDNALPHLLTSFSGERSGVVDTALTKRGLTRRILVAGDFAAFVGREMEKGFAKAGRKARSLALEFDLHGARVESR